MPVLRELHRYSEGILATVAQDRRQAGNIERRAIEVEPQRTSAGSGIGDVHLDSEYAVIARGAFGWENHLVIAPVRVISGG